jgi:hypothetical protein
MGVGRQHQPNQSINALVDISTRIHHRVNDRPMVVFRARATPRQTTAD